MKGSEGGAQRETRARRGREREREDKHTQQQPAWNEHCCERPGQEPSVVEMGWEKGQDKDKDKDSLGITMNQVGKDRPRVKRPG